MQSRSLPQTTSYIPSPQRTRPSPTHSLQPQSHIPHSYNPNQNINAHHQILSNPTNDNITSTTNNDNNNSNNLNDIVDENNNNTNNINNTNIDPNAISGATLTVNCKMLPGVYVMAPIHDPTLLSQQPNMNRNIHTQRLNQHSQQQLHAQRSTHAIDLSLLLNILTIKTFPLQFATDEEGYLDLDYCTSTSSQIISQSTHITDSNQLDVPIPFTAITRIAPNEPLSLITPIQLLKHFISQNPSLSLPLPQQEEHLYCAIEIFYGEALDLTGFISTLTKPLIDRLGVNNLAYVSTYHTDVLLVPIQYARMAFSLLVEATKTSSFQQNSLSHTKLQQRHLNPDDEQQPLQSPNQQQQQGQQHLQQQQLQRQQSHSQQQPSQQQHHRQVVVLNPKNQVSLQCLPLSWFQLLYYPLLSILLSPTIINTIKPLHLIDEFYSKLSETATNPTTTTDTTTISTTQLQQQPSQQSQEQESQQESQIQSQPQQPTPSPELKLLQLLAPLQHVQPIPRYSPHTLFSIIISSHSVTILADKYLTCSFLLTALPLLHQHCILQQYPQLQLLPPPPPPPQASQQQSSNPILPPTSTTLIGPVVDAVTVHSSTWDIYHIFVGSSSSTGHFGNLVRPVSELLANNQISLIYLSTHTTDLLLCQTPSQQQTIQSLSQCFTVDLDDDN